MRARKLLRRAHRDKENAFLIEGPRAVQDALAAGAELEEIFVGEGALGANLLGDAQDVPIYEVSERVVKALSDSTTPQGVVAVARRPDTSLSALPADASLVLMLVNVGDPGNAGTLVRSAAAAGADAVVFATGSVDPFSPKTVRASAGLVARVPVVTAGLDGAVERLRAASITLIGAEARAERSCYEVDLSAPIAIVVGNEAAGLPPGARTAVDTTVSIPMPGGVESLNVGIAGSLLLYEAVRQRRYPDAVHD